MSKFILLAFPLSVFSASAHAAQVDRVIVRSQWPWHDGVKVEYALSDVTAPVNIRVSAFRDGTPIPVPARSIVGEVFGVEDCVGSFMIDPKILLGAEKARVEDLRIDLSLEPSSANVNEVLYKVFDLRTGVCEDITRRQILNGEKGAYETDYAKVGAGFSTPLEDVLVWTAVTNDVKYRTTHLVMRKISAAGKTWCSGDQDEAWYSQASLQPKVWVSLTYDYFISVFETTQAQYRLMGAGRLPEACAYQDADGLNPVNGVSRSVLVGNQATDYPDYWGAVTGECILFPTNSYVRDVGKISICNNLWKKSRDGGMCYEFGLPTGAEWEFACRAGSARTLYSGKDVSESAACELAWIGACNSGGTLREVGTRKPNAYGLYDMLGNALEHVSLSNGGLEKGRNDGGLGTSEGDPVIDPLGLSTTGCYALAGGGAATDSGHPVYEGQWTDARPTARRYVCEWYNARPYAGFRLVIPARADGQWADHPAR